MLRCSLGIEGALAALPSHKAGVTAMGVSPGGKLLLQGFNDGVVRVSEAETGKGNITGSQPTPQRSSTPFAKSQVCYALLTLSFPVSATPDLSALSAS